MASKSRPALNDLHVDTQSHDPDPIATPTATASGFICEIGQVGKENGTPKKEAPKGGRKKRRCGSARFSTPRHRKASEKKKARAAVAPMHAVNKKMHAAREVAAAAAAAAAATAAAALRQGTRKAVRAATQAAQELAANGKKPPSATPATPDTPDARAASRADALAALNGKRKLRFRAQVQDTKRRGGRAVLRAAVQQEKDNVADEVLEHPTLLDCNTKRSTTACIYVERRGLADPSEWDTTADHTGTVDLVLADMEPDQGVVQQTLVGRKTSRDMVELAS